MRVQIVPFGIESYDAVLALWQQCEGIGLREHSDSRERIQAYLRRNPGLSYLARAEGRVVGALLAGHDGRRGYIHHLAVHPKLRRRGIGERLVRRSLEALRREGIPKCHIFIYNENQEGRAFWEAAGWTPRSDISLMSRDLD